MELDQYSINQAKAIQIWEARYDEKAVYVQSCSSDYSEWRVSDIKASIRGYVDLNSGAITLYGQG